MAWIKWHTESAADPKFRVIAKHARVKIGEALAVWQIMLEYGYTHGGAISGLDPEIIEATLALKLEKVEAVIAVMREKGMLDGDRISKWEERQAIPAFEESSKIPLVKMTSTERSREYRARKKADATQCNAKTVACNADATQCNAALKEKIKNKEKEILNPPIPSLQGGTDLQNAPCDISARKKRLAGNSLADLRALMDSYTQNPLMLEKLEAYRQMRERIRKPLTAEGLRLALKKLDGLAGDDEGKIAILEQSIFNSWQGLFETRTASGIPPGQNLKAPTEFQKNMRDRRLIASMLLAEKGEENAGVHAETAGEIVDCLPVRPFAGRAGAAGRDLCGNL